MSKLLLTLISGGIFFSACTKEKNLAPQPEQVVPCKLQTENPSGRSYSSGSVVEFNCTEKHCGLLPLSSKNYWVYEDSVYNYGVFVKVQYDTLRFSSNKKSLSDGLTWWESNIMIGLPEILYANDSAFFALSDRMFTPDVIDARKDFMIPAGDSVKYLSNFQDAAAQGRSVKLAAPVLTSFGTFNSCFFFEKNARNYRKDQIYFKPGLGVIKYIREEAPLGDRNIKLQQVSTLIAVHIE
ncbi:MAG: hypothetical protein SGI83_00005 [Bacteroidota bacterium]|nr:hypothetical protein [Bacteroidota bacterium]